jgi:hypothetical protein
VFDLSDIWKSNYLLNLGFEVGMLLALIIGKQMQGGKEFE